METDDNVVINSKTDDIKIDGIIDTSPADLKEDSTTDFVRLFTGLREKIYAVINELLKREIGLFTIRIYANDDAKHIIRIKKIVRKAIRSGGQVYFNNQKVFANTKNKPKQKRIKNKNRIKCLNKDNLLRAMRILERITGTTSEEEYTLQPIEEEPGYEYNE